MHSAYIPCGLTSGDGTGQFVHPGDPAYIVIAADHSLEAALGYDSAVICGDTAYYDLLTLGDHRSGYMQVTYDRILLHIGEQSRIRDITVYIQFADRVPLSVEHSAECRYPREILSQQGYIVDQGHALIPRPGIQPAVSGQFDQIICIGYRYVFPVRAYQGIHGFGDIRIGIRLILQRIRLCACCDRFGTDCDRAHIRCKYDSHYQE